MFSTQKQNNRSAKESIWAATAVAAAAAAMTTNKKWSIDQIVSISFNLCAMLLVVHVLSYSSKQSLFDGPKIKCNPLMHWDWILCSLVPPIASRCRHISIGTHTRPPSPLLAILPWSFELKWSISSNQNWLAFRYDDLKTNDEFSI